MANPFTIPASRCHFSEADRKSILSQIDRCLEAGSIAQGRNVEEFEELFRRYVGADHAVSLNSCGSALEAAMRALDVQGKEVLVPTNTFLATAAGVVTAGGHVRLIDIDPATLSPSCDSIMSAISGNTCGVILVHVGGIISREIREIRNLCDERGIWLFEDCAHAHGSMLGTTHAGLFGIGGAYSFFATKVMTCGEGGMVVTGDENLAKRIRLLRDYGKPHQWETLCVEFGLSWRLNELAAIVGVSQLGRLDEFIEWRARIAALYSRLLAPFAPLRIIHPHGRTSWYKYVVILPDNIDRSRVKQYAKDHGVSLAGGVYDVPLHKQPAMMEIGAVGSFPNADAFCAQHICLPIYFGMRDEEAEYVVKIITKAANLA